MSDIEFDEPPSEVVATLTSLDEALDAVMAPKHEGTNLIVGTWNLRAFGKLTKAWSTPAGASPKRNVADVHAIARFVQRCDIVAIQEIHGDLRALRYLMKVLGEDWAFMLTDVTKGKAGNDERLGFVFDTRRVKPSGLACELVVPVQADGAITAGAFDRQFARTPYAVSFASAGQTMVLVTLHIDYGRNAEERHPELAAIAQWLAEWAETEFSWNHNLIALGDFNIDDRAEDPLLEAFTSTGLTPAPKLRDLPRTIFDKPTTAHYYDQIAWFTQGQTNRPALILDCVDGGNFDFVPLLRGNLTPRDLSWHISDHYPLWVEFALPRNRSRRTAQASRYIEPGVGEARRE